MPKNRLPDHPHAEVLSRISAVPNLARTFIPIGRARDLYYRVKESGQGFGLEGLLAEMRIDLQLTPTDQARIPAKGPVVAVANHPYGVLDGAILAVLLSRVRPDVKLLTNFLLGDIPELQQQCIFVDPYQKDHSVESNRKALREALSWLQQGGMLAIFPAGEVSHWQMPTAEIADPQWNDTAVRLIRRTRATALPIYFCGHNNLSFQLFGLIHPSLRTAFLLQEFLQQEGKRVEVRIGTPISPDAIQAVTDDRDALEYLRWRTYLLARRHRKQSSWPAVLRSKLAGVQRPIAPAATADALAEEIENLPADRFLAANKDLAVYFGYLREIPQLLLEIGRLREVTFRAAGEGTGKDRDLDRFDDYYAHIVMWNKNKRELVGAYRAGNVPEIVSQYGVSGLYTSTLFHYQETLLQKLGPALELGRSFVRPEYQRQYAPLFLLWKGIARMVAQRPQTPVLFGAVSISNDYTKASREMIYRYFEGRIQDHGLAHLVRPRRPFRAGVLQRCDYGGMSRALRDLDELSEPISDVEADGKGLPVLLRQYAKVGGELLGFNVDRKFSNVLDGLVIVDLRRTDPSVLERYMGRESTAAFRNFHGLSGLPIPPLTSPLAVASHL